MNRLVMMAVAAGAAMAAMAMPTRQQLAKAQEMVSDVTAADVAALKAGAKKPAEVAAKHMELAAQAGSEAEKYLLLQGAFRLYVKGEDYDNAAKAIETMQTEIKDFNPEVIVELCGKALVRKMQENAPRLYAIKENARRIVFYRKQLPIREAAVRKNPKDPQAQRRLAECHAELGDWTKALEVFAKAGDEFKKMAEGETSGKVSAQELGDFWWDYETKSDTQVYKLHAAELYRKALADDTFKGLARTRAEQRAKEVETSGYLVVVTKSANTNALPVPKFEGGERFKVVLDAKKNINLELVACPAGKFVQGCYPSGYYKKHTVELTYPFLIMPGRLTYATLTALDKEIGQSCRLRSGFKNFITDDVPAENVYRQELEMCFAQLKALAEKDGNFRVFHDYEFRLPTQAEYEYAYWARDTGGNMGSFGDADREKAWLSLGAPKGDSVYCYPPLPESYVLKIHSKNAWGLYDMKNGFEPLVDKVPAPLNKNGEWEFILGNASNDVFSYADEEVNPLRWYTGKDASGISICQWICCGGFGEKNTRVRLVYGPKLSALNVYPRTEKDGPVKRIGEKPQ